MRNISSVVSNNLCTGCGICENICPTHSIKMTPVSGSFVPEIKESTCISDKGCKQCLKVCPGHELNLKSMSDSLFGSDKDVHHDSGIGYYKSLHVGYSTDKNLRYHSASGGVTSQFLIWLLEKGYVNGVVVTQFDPSNKFLVKSFIARTKDEITNAKSSKYSPVSLHSTVREILKSEGVFAVVGLPCHIHGIRKYMDISEKLNSKIFGLFGIYCSSGRSFNATEFIFSKQNIDYKDLRYLSYRDEGNLGHIVVKGVKEGKENQLLYREKYRNYNLPLRSFFIPKRCLLCPDHFAELSDISFGDIYVKPYSDDEIGINSIITRNNYWFQLLLKASENGVLKLDNLSKEKLLASQKVLKHKKERMSTFLKIEKCFGKKIPNYDIEISDPHSIKSVVSYISSIFQIFIGRRRRLWFMVSLMAKKVK